MHLWQDLSVSMAKCFDCGGEKKNYTGYVLKYHVHIDRDVS